MGTRTRLMDEDPMEHFRRCDEAMRKYPNTDIFDEEYRPQWYYSRASGKAIQILRPGEESNAFS